MRIQNNIMALNTHRQYTINNNNIAKSLEKLSSGYRINRAGDDAAGLAISEKMRAQIRGLNMASKNSQDGISMIQTAEGALQSTHDILQRMRELAVQSSSDTNEQTVDRAALQQEFSALLDEVDQIAGKTRFNDQNLIDGTFQKNKMSLGSGTGTAFATTVGSMAILVDRATAGTHAVTITVNTPTAATPVSGTAATVTPSVTVTAGTGGAVNDLGSATVAFTAIPTAQHNGNTYVLTIQGSSADSMTLQLTDSNGNLVSQAQNVDMTAWSTSGSKTINFDGVGSLTLGLTTGTTVTANAAGASAVTAAFSGITFAFSTGGKDAGVTPAVRGSIDITIDNETVSVYMGDTTANFKNAGIQLSFTAISDADVAATGRFTAGDIVVNQTTGQNFVVQVGANQGDEQRINIDAMNSRVLGIAFSDISTQQSASRAITEVNSALNRVSTQRAALGALQNKLEFKINNLDTSAENLQAAESRIRDLDMASEMTNFTKANILSQASTAMLAQANALPQGVLQLLK